MVKTIFLLKKKPGMPREDFVKYYETNHARLGEKYVPNAALYVRRYLNPLPELFTGAVEEAEFDVLTEIWYRDMDAYREALAGLGKPEVVEEISIDEENLFDRPKNQNFIAKEFFSTLPWMAGRDPEKDTGLKALFFLKRKPGMTLGAFVEYYESNHRRLAEKHLVNATLYARRYLYPVPELFTGTTEESEFDVITEIWFRNVDEYKEAMAKMAGPEAAAEIVPDEENLFLRGKNRNFIVDEWYSKR